MDTSNSSHKNAVEVLKALVNLVGEPGKSATKTKVYKVSRLTSPDFWDGVNYLLDRAYVMGKAAGLETPLWLTENGMVLYQQELNAPDVQRVTIPAKLRGPIHKIAVLGKDFYTNSTIDDLFIFAGADVNWWQEPVKTSYSERITTTYGWIEGIIRNAPESLDKIVKGVALQITENEDIPEGDKSYLQRVLGMASHAAYDSDLHTGTITMPTDVERLLEVIIQNLPRAMFPLEHRRKGSPALAFDNEYDVQALLHALLRPWIKDIRAEEYTPSYAGSSTRIDFLLATYDIVIEVKYVRNKSHAKKIGDELIIDIAHYGTHEKARQLWIAIYDAQRLIPNPGGLVSQLNGNHEKQGKTIKVRTFVI